MLIVVKNVRKNMKKDKLEPIEAVARIKILIKRYFENVGRKENIDSDIDRIELIDDIEDVINRVSIEDKYLVLESISLDEENEKN